MEKLNKIFRTEQIGSLDRYTVEHEPIGSLELMERAAKKWAECFLTVFNSCPAVAIVAGSGNNGGDGYAIARILRETGVPVTVFRLMSNLELSPDCEANYKRWLSVGGELVEVKQPEDFRPGGGSVIIDAVFGSGLNRKITGLAYEVIRKINILGHLVVAVDIPSGLMGEDNAANDAEGIVRADYTFTFQFPKLAFMLPENARYVGQWKVLDIGLSREGMAKTATSWFYTTQEVAEALLPLPGEFDHKGINGRGLLIAGTYRMMGAAVLAARAALRSGIGLLYCHIPGNGVDIVQTAVPEALLDTDESKIRFSGVRKTGKFDAVAVGPALGQGPETVAGLRKLLQEWRGVTILDADALNILAEHPEWLELLHDRCILTPHLKEFERIAGKSRNDFERLNKLSIFATRFQVYVILKGAHTVVATPQGELHFNMSGNPGMAKAGAGDVLTGVLLALAANGIPPRDLARIGVFAHGLAADLLVREYGCRGISAGMIAEGMGKAWKVLEKG